MGAPLTSLTGYRHFHVKKRFRTISELSLPTPRLAALSKQPLSNKFSPPVQAQKIFILRRMNHLMRAQPARQRRTQPAFPVSSTFPMGWADKGPRPNAQTPMKLQSSSSNGWPTCVEIEQPEGRLAVEDQPLAASLGTLGIGFPWSLVLVPWSFTPLLVRRRNRETHCGPASQSVHPRVIGGHGGNSPPGGIQETRRQRGEF